MFLLEYLIKCLLVCLLWFCDLAGWKRTHAWLSKVVNEPAITAEKHVV